MDIIIRKATEADYPQILLLIQELADYENCPTEVETTTETMKKDNSIFDGFVAILDDKIIGTAIYFPYYSTWKGRCIYLEDIVVTEQYRKQGIGKLLFDATVKAAKEFDAKRLMWQVLNWNEPAINFYKKLSADLDGEWLNCKLTEEQIKNYQPEN